MKRFGYDPNEPRDDHGRWTGDAGAGADSGHVVGLEYGTSEKTGKQGWVLLGSKGQELGVIHGKPDTRVSDVLDRAISSHPKIRGDLTPDMLHALVKHKGFGRSGFAAGGVRTLDRAELFSVGTWNGMKFSEGDIDSIVSSFNALGLGGRVPLKLGHEGADARDIPESQFALGWVQAIWREGKTMFSRLDIPEKIFEAVKAGFLKFVSIELLHDVKAGTRVIPYVLDAVALLGTDQPAVGILKDLQALTMSRSAYSHRGRVTFRRGASTKGTSTMDEKEEAALRQQLADQKAKNETLQSQFTASENERKKDRAATRRREIKSTFEAAVAAKKILPKRLEAFTKMNKTDDDARVVDVTDGDVDSYISNFTEVDSAEIKKGEKGSTKGGVSSGADDNAEFVGKPNHEVFAALANARLVKMGGKRSDYRALQEAGALVMRENPKLAQAYHNNPNGEYVAE